MRAFVTATLVLLTLAGCAQLERPLAGLQGVTSDAGFATLEPRAGGRTYYVAGTGDDGNNGRSSRRPFRTLQHAADQTRPGDTVLVMNGTYTNSVVDESILRITRSGTAERYITYRAMTGHAPRIFVDNNYSGIRINAAYIVIDGFTVEGNLPNLSFAEADALARGTDAPAALSNSKFNSSGIASFLNEDGTGQPHHLIIRNNTVFNHPAGGIFSNNTDYVRIENNTVYNNSYYSAYANSGISFYKSRAVDSRTGIKMWIRNNVVYQNENRVPFWFSNAADPSKRVITDGNGIIIDDSRNTQGSDNVVYNGKFLVENNVVFDNGGRGVNVYSSDGVLVRNNTFYANGRTGNFTELGVGDAADVTFAANIFSARADRRPILSYNTGNITFTNNLFYGGSEAPQFPAGTMSNLIKNGDFSVDLSDWGLVKGGSAGFVNNTRDGFGRNCVYVNQASLPRTYDVYLFQKDLTLKRGYTYTLAFDVATSNRVRADFDVKFGGSAGAFTTYYGQTVSLPVGASATYRRTLAFTMTSETDPAAQLEFQVAGNPESAYFCFDNVVLSETDNLLGPDPRFVDPSTDPATADFRLQASSPALDAQTVVGPDRDILNTFRPQGAASDLGAYESY